MGTISLLFSVADLFLLVLMLRWCNSVLADNKPVVVKKIWSYEYWKSGIDGAERIGGSIDGSEPVKDYSDSVSEPWILGDLWGYFYIHAMDFEFETTLIPEYENSHDNELPYGEILLLKKWSQNVSNSSEGIQCWTKAFSFESIKPGETLALKDKLNCSVPSFGRYLVFKLHGMPFNISVKVSEMYPYVSKRCCKTSCQICDSSYSCYCYEWDCDECMCPGFAGAQCETNINECSSNPCQHSGECVDQENMYYCLCPVGYTGVHCDIQINECASRPCMNYGTCIDLLNFYTCACVGSKGIHCETDINECISDPCSSSATCINKVNRYMCVCPLGYTGRHCYSEVNECLSNPCQNGARCANEINKYTCHCVPGSTGQHCEIDSLDECESSPCKNDGYCNDLLLKFKCDCPPEFVGELCEDRNDCASHPCINPYTMCIDQIDKYECVCLPGYVGQKCEHDIDECESEPCENNAFCMDDINSYECHCHSGYSGHHCEVDIDECNSNPCQNNGICQDWPNGFVCHCAVYSAGTYCQECLTTAGGEELCTEEDICKTVVCLNGATCSPKPFFCICLPEFTGRRCETNYKCNSQSCVNGGQCQETAKGVVCKCLPKYTGSRCETRIPNWIVTISNVTAYSVHIQWIPPQWTGGPYTVWYREYGYRDWVLGEDKLPLPLEVGSTVLNDLMPRVLYEIMVEGPFTKSKPFKAKTLSDTLISTFQVGGLMTMQNQSASTKPESTAEAVIEVQHSKYAWLMILLVFPIALVIQDLWLKFKKKKKSQTVQYIAAPTEEEREHELNVNRSQEPFAENYSLDLNTHLNDGWRIEETET